MENIKYQEISKVKKNSLKNNFTNSNQEKIIRSKSKNIYPPKKTYKISTQNKHPKSKHSLNNNNIINNCPNENKEIPLINNNYIKKNSKAEQNLKKSDLIELKLLYEENISLKNKLIEQENFLKDLHNLFIHNYNKINSLRKKYSKYKHFLKYTIYGPSDEDEFMKEKSEEEYALKAVEQQIMDEICPNPDKMSYEQLLQLEEQVGSVNKGLSKEKIKNIPEKPFHKALFDDNLECIICMENFEENEKVKQLYCGHIFHGDCIDKWLEKEKKCPFCKAEC
jgi:hypothetical protein